MYFVSLGITRTDKLKPIANNTILMELMLCQGVFYFWQNWNNGRFEGFLGGVIPSIGEEIIPHHIGKKNYQKFQREDSV